MKLYESQKKKEKILKANTTCKKTIRSYDR